MWLTVAKIVFFFWISFTTIKRNAFLAKLLLTHRTLWVEAVPSEVTENVFLESLLDNLTLGQQSIRTIISLLSENNRFILYFQTWVRTTSSRLQHLVLLTIFLMLAFQIVGSIWSEVSFQFKSWIWLVGLRYLHKKKLQEVDRNIWPTPFQNEHFGTFWKSKVRNTVHQRSYLPNGVKFQHIPPLNVTHCHIFEKKVSEDADLFFINLKRVFQNTN